MRADPVLHFELKGNRTACGRRLPTAGFFTGDPQTFEESSTACRSCLRIYNTRNLTAQLTTKPAKGTS